MTEGDSTYGKLSQEDIDRLLRAGADEDSGSGKTGDSSRALVSREEAEDLLGRQMDSEEIIGDEHSLPLRDFQTNIIEGVRSGKLHIEKRGGSAMSHEKHSEEPESPEEKRIRRQERIEELREEVEECSKEYLEVDLKKNTAFARIRKFFSSKKEDRDKYEHDEDASKQDSDIAYLRAVYDNKLFDLQELLIEDAKERGASDEELAKLFVEFRRKQKTGLAEKHDEIKAEQKGFLGAFKKGAEKMTRVYQKIPFSGKIIIGATLFSAGASAGGITALAIGGVAIGWRTFGVLSAGFGAKTLMGGVEKWMAERDIRKEEQALLEFIGGLSEENKYKCIKGNIKDIAIKDGENSINRIKNWKLGKNAIAAAAGIFIGSGAMFDLAKWGFHGAEHAITSGNFDVSNVFAPDGAQGGSGGFDVNNVFSPDGANGDAGGFDINNVYGADGHAPGVAGGAEGSWDAPSAGTEQAGAVSPGVPVPESAPGAEILDVKKGSSFEGTIIKFLDEHREEFLKNHPELAKFDDGQIAHRIALDFEDAHPQMAGHLPDLVHAGAKLTFDPVTMNVEINDSHGFGYFTHTPEGEVGHHIVGHSSIPSVEAGAELPGSGAHPNLNPPDLAAGVVDVSNGANSGGEFPVNFEMPNSDIPAEEIRQAVSNGEFVPTPLESAAEGAVNPAVDNVAESINETNKKAAGIAAGVLAGMAATPFAIERHRKVKKALKEMDKVETKKKIEKMIGKEMGTIGLLRFSLDKITSGSSLGRHEFWNEIKDKPFDIKKLSKDGRERKGMRDAIKEFKKIIGKEAEPRKNPLGDETETVRQWMARVIKASIEKTK